MDRACVIGVAWPSWGGFGVPWRPVWLSHLIGVDYFGHVTSVGDRSSHRTTKAASAHVGRLGRLADSAPTAPAAVDSLIWIVDGGSRDGVNQAVKHFATKYAGSKRLGEVAPWLVTPLCNSLSPSAEMAHLGRFTQVEKLRLSGSCLSDGGTQVTDSGLMRLKEHNQAFARLDRSELSHDCSCTHEEPGKPLVARPCCYGIIRHRNHEPTIAAGPQKPIPKKRQFILRRHTDHSMQQTIIQAMQLFV